MSHIATVETNKLLTEVLYELQKIRLSLEDIKVETYSVGEVCYKRVATEKVDDK
jgi:hypothetical protein